MRTSVILPLALAAPGLALGFDYRSDARRTGNMIKARYSATAQNLTESQRAAAVVEGFRHAWAGYKAFAFPDDDLLPVTGGGENDRNGWGASAVDAFDTAIVMRQQDITDEILNYIPTINFQTTNESVSLFETTIRYIGGILSGYDLLTGPFANETSNQTAYNALLGQAESLANVLSFAFDTPSGIPYNDLNITAQVTTDPSPQNGLATIGTLVLEWTRLSDLTGNATYGELAQKGESYLLNPQPAWAQPFPGLVGTNVNITDGQFLDATGGWVGGDDSFYEYLIKMYVYDSSRFGSYKDRWVAAADSSIQYLASHPSTRPDITFLAQFENTTLVLDSEHLACFDGGNFILGGLALNESKYTDFGLQLTAGCHQTYNATATHIGPEQFSWDPNNVPADQADFYQANGFYLLTPSYDLRPEVVESYYYAYRLTGDKQYQDWAWDAFVAINATCYTPLGYTRIEDVNDPTGGAKDNFQESFLFAELMKYAYLIHAEDGPWQVNYHGSNTFVYNTEAHPFKVAGPQI